MQIAFLNKYIFKVAECYLIIGICVVRTQVYLLISIKWFFRFKFLYSLMNKICAHPE